MKKDVEFLKSKKLNDQQKQQIDEASSRLDKAGELLGQNNAKEAAALMSEAGASINTVKMAVLKVSARDKIAELRKEVELLKKVRGSENAGEDIAEISAALNEAESLLDQEKTEEALKKISEAEQLLVSAKEKTTKGLALEKAKSVEKMLAEARKKDTKNRFKTEIDNAATMLDDGKKLLESGSYTESLAKFEEAESLLNSIGIASEKDRLGQDGSSISKEGKRMYRVIFNRKKRDCLWRIAGKVYKNERLWPLIYVANKDQIKDPDLIFPGQKFIIPEIPEKEEKSGKSDTSDTSDKKEKGESGKDAGGATTDTKTDSTDEE